MLDWVHKTCFHRHIIFQWCFGRDETAGMFADLEEFCLQVCFLFVCEITETDSVHPRRPSSSALHRGASWSSIRCRCRLALFNMLTAPFSMQLELTKKWGKGIANKLNDQDCSAACQGSFGSTLGSIDNWCGDKGDMETALVSAHVCGRG